MIRCLRTWGSAPRKASAVVPSGSSTRLAAESTVSSAISTCSPEVYSSFISAAMFCDSVSAPMAARERGHQLVGVIGFLAHVFVQLDLRIQPQLEAARERCDDRQGSIRLGRFAAVLIVFTLVSVPLSQRMAAWYERIASPSSVQLQERALEIANDRSIGPHWGLFEAYSQLRRSQAARFGQASITKSMP